MLKKSPMMFDNENITSNEDTLTLISARCTSCDRKFGSMAGHPAAFSFLTSSEASVG
jgi:hypothetical protein